MYILRRSCNRQQFKDQLLKRVRKLVPTKYLRCEANSKTANKQQRRDCTPGNKFFPQYISIIIYFSDQFPPTHKNDGVAGQHGQCVVKHVALVSKYELENVGPVMAYVMDRIAFL